MSSWCPTLNQVEAAQPKHAPFPQLPSAGEEGHKFLPLPHGSEQIVGETWQEFFQCLEAENKIHLKRETPKDTQTCLQREKAASSKLVLISSILSEILPSL